MKPDKIIAADSFARSSVAVCCVCLCWTFVPAAMLAATEVPPAAQRGGQIQVQAAEREQEPPLRIPPKVAIDACEGKKEGDSCSFRFPEGIRSGLCLSGRENVFACRPHRGPPPAAAPTGGEPVPAERPAMAAKPQTAPDPADGSTPARSHKSIKDNSVTDEAARLTVHQPAAPAPSPVERPSAPPLPDTAVFPHSGQNAGSLWVYPAIAVAAAGLTWLWFNRYTTAPLRRLRKVTQKLAGGDLTARVGEGLLHRKDEVVELGRDVDRMAERIESLVGAHQRLIRDVSHELRSPLARLNVALELARQAAGPVHTAPFDRIERESERLNELIGQLLMLTKLESENSMSQRSEIEISALIREVAQDVDFEARSNDRAVTVKTAEPVTLSGNRELLRQALENLVRNAARYTAAGTAVEISLRKKETASRSWAHIEVRDQGPGVPENELFDIFRPFYRVSDSRERQSGGTGVGLAISDRAVRLHGGSLRAFNAPGCGLVMEMELPVG